MLAEQPSDWLVYHDERGTVRVITQPLPLTGVIEAAFSKIRYASGGNPTVVIHLLRTIGRLAPFLTTREQPDALAAQADAAAEEALKALALETDRSAALDSYTRTCQLLGRPAYQNRTTAGSESATSARGK